MFLLLKPISRRKCHSGSDSEDSGGRPVISSIAELFADEDPELMAFVNPGELCSSLDVHGFVDSRARPVSKENEESMRVRHQTRMNEIRNRFSRGLPF
jgi:hypothetical protein